LVKSQLVLLKVIIEVRWLETMPVDHRFILLPLLKTLKWHTTIDYMVSV
jgi:hypothetical protein